MTTPITQEQIDRAMRDAGEAIGGVAVMLQHLGTSLIKLSSDLDHAFERLSKLSSSPLEAAARREQPSAETPEIRSTIWSDGTVTED